MPFVTGERVDGALPGRIPQSLADGTLEHRVGKTLDAARSHVMLCGHSGMITDAVEVLEARGMRRHRRREPGHEWIKILGAREHNLRDVSVDVPLGCFVAVTGTQGKSSTTRFLASALEAAGRSNDIVFVAHDLTPFTRKPLVDGSIFRFEGQVSVFYAKEGPCYRCLYSEPPPPGLVPSCAEGGVRGVEIGSLMFEHADPDTGEMVHPAMELVRLAIPRRVYTQSHIDYVIETFREVMKYKDQARGFRITYEPHFLRHFTAHFERV